MADTVTKFDIIAAYLTLPAEAGTVSEFHVGRYHDDEDRLVSSIDIVPAGLPGFYVLIIHFDDDSQRSFFVSPGTVILEGGNPQQEEVVQKPQIVIPDLAR